MDWYAYFLLTVLVLWIFAAPQDRNALRIVLIASLFSEVIVDVVTHPMTAAWKLAIPGAVETLTIVSLLHWSKNRSGYWNAGFLIFAWIAHLLCYFDATFKTDLVYSRYEVIIQLVAIGQLASFHETFAHIADSCLAGIHSLRGSVSGLRVARIGDSVLHCEASEVVSEDDRTEGVQ